MYRPQTDNICYIWIINSHARMSLCTVTRCVMGIKLEKETGHNKSVMIVNSKFYVISNSEKSNIFFIEQSNAISIAITLSVLETNVCNIMGSVGMENRINYVEIKLSLKTLLGRDIEEFMRLFSPLECVFNILLKFEDYYLDHL